VVAVVVVVVAVECLLRMYTRVIIKVLRRLLVPCREEEEDITVVHPGNTVQAGDIHQVILVLMLLLMDLDLMVDTVGMLLLPIMVHMDLLMVMGIRIHLLEVLEVQVEDSITMA
jgi:hypothetical protein